MTPGRIILSLATLTLANHAMSQTPARVKPSDIRPERELLITHPAVVDSEVGSPGTELEFAL